MNNSSSRLIEQKTTLINTRNSIKRGSTKILANKISDINPFNDLIESFKNILNFGISNSKFFLNKDTLNIEEINEKFYLEQILKINNFCEEVESLSITFDDFRKVIDAKRLSNSITINEDEKLQENPVDNININVQRMASERRLSVYQNLFESIKKSFDDILKISNKFTDKKTKMVLDFIEDHTSELDENNNIYLEKLLNPNAFNDKKKKFQSNLEIIDSRYSGSNSICIINSFENNSDYSISSIENISINEETNSEVRLPESKIKEVSMSSKVRHTREKTAKDILVYRSFYKKIKQNKMNSQTSKNSSYSSLAIDQTVAVNKKNSNELNNTHLFIRARKELQENNRTLNSTDKIVFEI